MNSRSAPLLCVAAALMGSLSACDSSSSSSSVPQSPVNSSSSSYASAGASLSVAATDCSQSSTPVSTPSTIPAGTISAETDSTQTSLLIENTGDQTLLVIPQQNTYLQQTPDVNPTDPVDAASLKAIAQAAFLATDESLPAGTQLDTVYIVPPKYGVCGTVAEVGDYPVVSVVRDREASAIWVVAHAVAQSLYDRTTSQGNEDVQAITTCVNDTASLASTQPDLSDLDLYATVMQTAASCYESYKAVFQEEEEADRAEEDASETREDVLKLLDKAPDLLEDIRFAIDFVHK
jgi:hypothetical protein